MKTVNTNLVRTRKFYFVLPILVIPFLTIIFWVLGGGSGVPAEVTASPTTGLNLDLPPAQLINNNKMWDKLALYEKAKQDSMRYQEAKRNDPYFHFSTLTSFNPDQDSTKKNVNSSLGKRDPYLDHNEKRVNEKINALYQQINKPEAQLPAPKQNRQPVDAPQPEVEADIKRLESMMSDLNAPPPADPEMKQMETMLDKILDIQHPERVSARAKETQNAVSPTSLTVVDRKQADVVSGFEPIIPDFFDTTAITSLFAQRVEQNGFFGIDDEKPVDNNLNGIEAIVHDQQVLVSGSTVKMRLVNDIDVKGTIIPAHSFIYGMCSINGERLTITINSVRLGNTILPVTLAVYDLDGIPGIYIPGAITRDVAKQSASQSIQDIQLMSMNPSLEVQAAGAGLEAVKGMFTKKIKLIKVTVKAGYRVLLKNQN